MTLQECYAAIGGDYEDVEARMMGAARVQKFLLRFLSDTSYEFLIDSLAAKNYEEAFRAAHTLKGVCQNLGITRLGNSAHDLTEALRDTPAAPDGTLIQKVTEDYKITAAAIHEFQEGLE